MARLWRQVGLITFLSVFALGVCAQVATQPVIPRVTNIHVVSGATVSPGGTLTLGWSFAAGGTDTPTEIDFDFRSGTVTRRIVAQVGNNGIGTSYSATVGTDWPNGAYQLKYVTVIEHIGGYTIFQSDGSISYTLAPWLTAAGPAENFSNVGFTVSGSVSTTSVSISNLARTSADPLTAGSPATFTCGITGGTAPYSASLVVVAPGGFQHSVTGSISGTQATFSLPTTAAWANGAYTVQYVTIKDAYGTASYGPGSAAIPASTGFSLTGGPVPPHVPVMSAVARTSSNGTTGGSYSYTATSSDSTISSVVFEFVDPLGYTHDTYGVGSSANTPAFGSTWMNGLYQLSKITLTDAIGRTATYYRDGSVDQLTAQRGTHAFDFTALDFTLTDYWNPTLAITTQPASVTVQPGGSATLSVTVTASVGATYQWYTGQSGDTSAAIAGATASSFVVRPASTTSYWVRTTTSQGPIDSTTATVTVAYTQNTPQIVTQPTAINAASGTTHTLTAFAVGPAPLSYQWYKDSSALTGATTAQLAFASGQAADNGSYVLKVTNPNGTTSTNPISVTFTDPPRIVTALDNVSIIEGQTLTLTVTATGSALTYKWTREQGTIPAGIDTSSATLTLPNIALTDQDEYTVTVTNAAGSASSSAYVEVVPKSPPVAPPNQTAAGTTNVFFSYQCLATGATAWADIGLPRGLSMNLDTGLITGTPLDPGTYTVSVYPRNRAGTILTSVTITIGGQPVPPVITTNPASVTVDAGGYMTFRVDSSGSVPMSFQWSKDGVAIPGATDSICGFGNISVTAQGAYTVTVTNRAGTVTSAPAVLTVVPRAHLVNVSVRANAGTGDQSLILGFVLNGAAAKPILLRGVGPGLAPFGVTSYLADPKLTLYDANSHALADDDNWDTALTYGGVSIQKYFQNTGAFGLADGSKDAVLLPVLAGGQYSAGVSSATPNSGVALIEGYDAGPTSPTEFKNLSVRANAEGGEGVMTAGFVVSGYGSRQVLIRAVGPGLAPFGVTGTLADPKLTLWQGNQSIGENDNWGGRSDLKTAFQQTGAFGLSDNSTDAALVTTLSAGAYTAQVTSGDGTSGVTLLEVYELP